MIAFNKSSDLTDILENFDASDLDTETRLNSMILDIFNSMSSKEFVDYISGPLRDDKISMAYKYLFELLDDNNRIDEILGYAEKKGVISEDLRLG